MAAAFAHQTLMDNVLLVYLIIIWLIVNFAALFQHHIYHSKIYVLLLVLFNNTQMHNQIAQVILFDYSIKDCISNCDACTTSSDC